jgi:hypothetical protein
MKTVDEFTPVANAIRSRDIPDWMIMIITDGKFRDIVSKHAEDLLFS